MIILIDTCILYSDRFLRGKVYKILRLAHQVLGARIVVPEIVLEELHRQYEDDLARVIRTLRAQVSRVQNLGVDVSIASDNIESRGEALASGFRSAFSERLATIKGGILGYPDIPHSSIAARAVRRIKPFADSGKGYQDTLLWLSALQIMLAQPEETLVLLTSNTADFAEKDKLTLHGELLVDLERHGINRERISFICSITDLYQNFIEPTQEQLGATRERFNENEEWVKRTSSAMEEILEAESFRLVSSRILHRDIKEMLSLTDIEIHSLEATDAWSEGKDVILAGNAEATGKAVFWMHDGWQTEDVDCAMTVSFSAIVDTDTSSILDVAVTDCTSVEIDEWWD